MLALGTWQHEKSAYGGCANLRIYQKYPGRSGISSAHSAPSWSRISHHSLMFVHWKLWDEPVAGWE